MSEPVTPGMGLDGLRAAIEHEVGATERGIQLQELRAVMKGQLSETEQVRAVHVRLGRYLQDVGPPTRPLACAKGCSMCCHYRVLVRAQEAFLLADWLRRAPVAVREPILQRLRLVAQQVSRMSPDEHVQTNIACPFLEASSGACQSYDVRPLACRRHHSLDAHPCRETFEDTAAQDECPMDPAYLWIHNAVEEAALFSNRSIGADCTVYELSTAVLAAMENPAAVKRWRNGKVSFPGAVRTIS